MARVGVIAVSWVLNLRLQTKLLNDSIGHCLGLWPMRIHFLWRTVGLFVAVGVSSALLASYILAHTLCSEKNTPTFVFWHNS